MLRFAFLLLVVLGGLAVVLGLAVGVGTWQAARLQEAPPGDGMAVTATTAAGSTTRPAEASAEPGGAAALGGTPPVGTGRGAPPAAAADPGADRSETGGAAADRRRGDPAANGDGNGWPPADPAAGGRKRRPPREPDEDAPPPAVPLLPLPLSKRDPRAVDPRAADARAWEPREREREPRVLPVDPAVPPVVLDAASAEVRRDGIPAGRREALADRAAGTARPLAGVAAGAGLRLAGDGGDPVLVDWRGEFDTAVWAVDVPRTGIYVVEVEYACDAATGGGTFWVLFAHPALPGVRPRVTGVVAPTAGWDDYRPAVVGTTYLPAGKAEVLVRPVTLKPGRRLMNLRAVRLRLVTDGRGKDRHGPDIRA